MTDTAQQISELARLLAKPGRSVVSLHQAIVAGYGAGSLQILFQGQQPGDEVALAIGGIRFLSSYVPKIGDTVHVLGIEGDRIVIGKVNVANDVTPEIFEIGVNDAPVFTNGWINVGGSYGTAKYRVDVDGWVHFSGYVSSGTATSPMFTMPAGLRPNSNKRFIVSRRTGVSGSEIWALIVDTNGQVFLENKTPPAGLNLGVSLQGVRYMAEDLLPDHSRSHEWTPFIYPLAWAWDQSHDGFDYPAAWQRWDGLVRLRGHIAGFGSNQMVYVPERAAKRRYSALFMTLNDSGSALSKYRVDFQPYGRVLNNITNPGGNDVTLDSMQWFADLPEHLQAPLELRNSWVAYSTDGSWGAPTYFLDGYGEVHVRGLVRSGITTSGTVIGWLPEGFRPAAREVFPGAQGGDGINPSLARLEVDADGSIYLLGNAGTNSFLSLDHISFLAAN